MQETTSGSSDSGRKDTVLFAQIIEMLTQNAVMLMGMVPDPRGRQMPPDLNGAEMIIDMLGVIQKKTKGNLTKEEEKMVSSTLYSLQTAFAEVAGKSGEFEKARKATEAASSAAEGGARQAPPPRQEKPQPTPAPSRQEVPATDRVYENKVKFTKKYG